ncbi:hypothetical protein DZC78_14035 [Olleya aquimaris]|nr:hypothetical protein DZC78_14035 [Olleya aquimaris]
MIRQKITLVLVFTFLLTTSMFSQTRSKTTIVENVNATKAGLIHGLNKTGDTIVLKSNKDIYRFTFLFHNKKESIMMDLGSKEAKIPLHHFNVGRYTVVAYREDAVYPISLNRIQDIAKPTNAVTDLEEDVLRASLSKEEQRKRSITPRASINKDTRLASATIEEDEISFEEKLAKERKLVVLRQREYNARIKREVEAKSMKEQVFAQAEANKKVSEQKRLAKQEAKRHEIKEKEANTVAARYKRNQRILKQHAATLASSKKKVDTKEVKYNISEINNNSLEKQTREEYRKQNLRPNGLPYED